MKLTHEQAMAAHEAGLILEYMDKDNQEWCARASHEVRPRAADVYRVKPGQPHADVRIALAMGKKCEWRDKEGPLSDKWREFPKGWTPDWDYKKVDLRIAEPETAQQWARERNARARGLRVLWGCTPTGPWGVFGKKSALDDWLLSTGPLPAAWVGNTFFKIHEDDEAAFQAMEQAEKKPAVVSQPAAEVSDKPACVSEFAYDLSHVTFKPQPLHWTQRIWNPDDRHAPSRLPAGPAEGMEP